MLIAKEKKRENIAEYLLYMWQIEDIIRANGLNIDKIRQNIIDRYECSDEIKMEMTSWYGNLIEMMRSEGIVETGHLQINNNVISELSDLHSALLNSTQIPQYGGVFFKALPYIVELRKRQGECPPGEIETCFNALYGILLLKLSAKEISSGTQEAMKYISTFVSVLAAMYKKDKNGELEL
ncbi:MAG: DUF4924 family protein [Bacteroidales bacterium]